MQGRTRRLGERALMVLFAALCLAAFGFAGRAEALQGTQVTIQAHVRLNGGDRMLLRADSYNGHEEVQLSVGDLSPTSAQYTAYVPRRVEDAGPRRISAKLGERGSVAMQFEPQTKRVVRTFGCDHYTIRQGVLRGRIRFRGEQRYVDVDRKRMHARLISYRVVGDCHRRAAQEPISLITCRKDGSSLFAGRLKSRSIFSAYGPDRVRRGLRIYEGAYAISDASDFDAAGSLESATLTPPFPFTGSAEYGDKELTGDLAMTTLSGAERQLAPAKAKIKYGRGIGITCSFSIPAATRAALPPGVISGRNPIAAIP